LKPAKTYGEEADFTLFKNSEDHVFNTIKDQDCMRPPWLLPRKPKGKEAENSTLSMTEWVTVPLVAALSKENSRSL